MTPRIKIEVGKIDGPWLDVLIERVKQDNVVSIIPTHLGPGLTVPPHTAKPEVLSGMWELTPDAEKSTSGVQLVGVQSELPPQDLESVYFLERWGRLQLVIEKAGIGFFKVEVVAIVGNRYVTRSKELVQLLDQNPIVLDVLLVTGVVGERTDRDFLDIGPAVGEA